MKLCPCVSVTSPWYPVAFPQTTAMSNRKNELWNSHEPHSPQYCGVRRYPRRLRMTSARPRRMTHQPNEM